MTKKTNTRKKATIADEIFTKVKFSLHPHAKHIRISEPFLVTDKKHGDKVARIHHYILGVNSSHKKIKAGGFQIISDDKDQLLLNNLSDYSVDYPDENEPDQID